MLATQRQAVPVGECLAALAVTRGAVQPEAPGRAANLWSPQATAWTPASGLDSLC